MAALAGESETELELTFKPTGERRGRAAGFADAAVDFRERAMVERVGGGLREIATAGLDLHETTVGQQVGGEVAAHHARGVEADRPLELVDIGARGVAVDDEGRAVPAIGPKAAVGAVGAFARAALFVNDLDASDDGGGLF